mmetsp:Transcript_64457/g.153848  ORF Transcript_64457/g.153848 Transcript_64457/m.153848 type:complete len:1243 (+) Transcript_64457:75-3803(+)
MQGRKGPSKAATVYLLNFSVGFNRVFLAVIRALQTLILPQCSAYQWRTYFIWAAQVFSCDLMLVTLCKFLQVYYRVENFLLLLSIGSVVPFLQAIRNLWTFVPCPPIVAVISNSALIFALIVLVMLGLGTYGSDFWLIYTYTMMIWPWLILASMVSRLYIERNLKRNPFSPVRELPVLGIISAFALILMLQAAKKMTVMDCMVMTFLDPAFAAIVASLALGSQRQSLHFRNAKVYMTLIVMALVYVVGEVGSGAQQVSLPSENHLWFGAGRFIIAARSAFVKWQYASAGYSEPPPKLPESSRMFYDELALKHRFDKFPSPVLLTLDCIWDSGLRDAELHGMGPLGTQDLYLLTELTYLLPMASIMAWINELDTLKHGISPVDVEEEEGGDADADGTDSTQNVVRDVREMTTGFDTVIITGVALMFIFARALVPWATARALFDRASSVHSWKYQPVVSAAPFLFLDVAYLNVEASKFQILVCIAIGGVVAHYRSNLWSAFHRKYLLLCTQELYYHQPSVLRKLQRETMIEFLKCTSTEDYGLMLLETAIRHGNNIRELARDTSIKVWDPSPAATAAWKLAFSLVTKSLRRQKAVNRQKRQDKADLLMFVEKLVVDIAYNAVDFAEGHGIRLAVAGSFAIVLAKRRAIRRLRALAERRRHLREKRHAGQLSNVPMQIATTGGTIRSVKDMSATMSSQGATIRALQDDGNGFQPGRSHMKSLPAPPEPRTSVGSHPIHAQHLSLTSGSRLGGVAGSDHGVNVTSTSLPHAPARSTAEEWMAIRGGDGMARGVWSSPTSPMDTGMPNLSGIPSLVLAFGDGKRGQLGYNFADSASRRGENLVRIVEELRGYNPVQVEAAGAASLVVGARGEVWGFGSNRVMELGLRKEVVQVNSPQRVKTLRDHSIVQASSTSAACGQAHTLVLTAAGEVYTFGTSSTGSLGQGPDVTQTAPLLLRMTSQVRIKYVAAGARHTILLADNGMLYAVGENDQGQLGVANPGPPKLHAPEPIGGDLLEKRVCTVAVGDDHSLAATEDHELYAWGANASGQLGINRVDNQPLPQPVHKLRQTTIRSLAGGTRHSLVVTTEETDAPGSTGISTQVWAFGSNVRGQLGLGASSNTDGQQRTNPVLVRALSMQREMEVVQVVAAADHSLALTNIGEVYGFGDNSYGQLGYPPEGRGSAQLQAAATSMGHATGQAQRRAAEVDMPRLFATGISRLWTPIRLINLSLYRVRALSTADTHSLALAQ